MRPIATLSPTLLAILASAAPLVAQAHATHRHPSGAKIIMTGVLVEPLCHFAQKPTGPALQTCLKGLSDQQLQPALLNTDDSTLYLLRSPAGGPLGPAQVRRLLGQTVKVDGTVFPAGNTYLIVVDSLRLNTP
jgi:hypothetical protein